MEIATAKSQIEQTFKVVSNYSYKKKMHEEIINDFLDKVLIVQKSINDDSEFLENLCVKLEKLTWIPDENIEIESYKMINDIIAVTRDIHRMILMHYVNLNKVARPYASKEIKRLKVGLDDIKECITDFENIFFKIPNDEEFKTLNQRLQAL